MFRETKGTMNQWEGEEFLKNGAMKVNVLTYSKYLAKSLKNKTKK